MFGTSDYPEDAFFQIIPTNEWMWNTELPVLLPPSAEFASVSAYSAPSSAEPPFAATFAAHDSWEIPAQLFAWPPEHTLVPEPLLSLVLGAEIVHAFNYSYHGDAANDDTPSPPAAPVPLPFPNMMAVASLRLSVSSVALSTGHSGSDAGSPGQDDLFQTSLDDRPYGRKVTKLLELYPNHVTKLAKPIGCCHCKEVFRSTVAYAEHLDVYDVAVQHTCPVADCPFNYIGFCKKVDLRVHVFNAHFKKKKGLKHHKPDPHGDHIKNMLTDLLYICEDHHCLRPFYRRDSLTRHMRLVHKVNPSTFNPRLGRKNSYGTFSKD